MNTPQKQLGRDFVRESESVKAEVSAPPVTGPRFTLTNLLWIVTLCAMLLGSYVLGRQHADSALRQKAFEDGAEHIRNTELAGVSAERDAYKSEVEQLRDYSQKLVESKFKEWRETAKR